MQPLDPRRGNHGSPPARLPACSPSAGISGAGRSAKQNLLYAEATEGINAYGVTRHRHMPEIEQVRYCVVLRKEGGSTGRLEDRQCIAVLCCVEKGGEVYWLEDIGNALRSVHVSVLVALRLSAVTALTRVLLLGPHLFTGADRRGWQAGADLLHPLSCCPRFAAGADRRGWQGSADLLHPPPHAHDPR